MPPIKVGEIWFCERVPSPDSLSEKKDRYVMVIAPPETRPAKKRQCVFAVAVSTKPSAEKIASGVAFNLPSYERYAETLSGLPCDSWAIADWLLEMNACMFDRRAGSVNREFVERAKEIIAARRIKSTEKFCRPEMYERCEFCV